MLKLKEMGTMLPKEMRKIHEERHELLLKEARARFGNSDGIQYSEAVWEHTLGELTGGEYDSVLGLRFYIAELRAKLDRQAFIDNAATRLCVIARPGSEAKQSDLGVYARIAYDQAEALWRERQKRRNGTDAEIPF